jgi:hypothetical protein
MTLKENTTKSYINIVLQNSAPQRWRETYRGQSIVKQYHHPSMCYQEKTKKLQKNKYEIS